MKMSLLKKSVIGLEMPPEMQERIIKKSYAYFESKSKMGDYFRLRRVAAIACSFIVILALTFGIFPFPGQNNNGQIEFYLTGLTVTAYAAEVSNGYMKWNIQMLEEFDSINISQWR